MSFNLKAQFETRKAIYWTAALVIITLMVFTLAYALSSYKNNVTKIPPELDAELISFRFTNIPECFAFQDPHTGRVYPGMIDLTKFNQNQLEQCYRTDEQTGFKQFNFRLVLEQEDLELLTNNYFHQDRDDLTVFKEVLVRTGNSFTKDQLIVYVQEKI